MKIKIYITQDSKQSLFGYVTRYHDLFEVYKLNSGVHIIDAR